MFKKLIAPAVVLSLALAGGARPADAASAEDVAKIIAGLAVVGIIAKAAEDNKGRSDVSRSSSASRYYDDNRYSYDNRYDNRDASRGRGPGYGDGWRKMLLPGECVRTVDTRRGDVRVVGESCLQREGVRVSRLPNRCEFDVRVGGRMRDAYAVNCLRQAGYQFDGDNRRYGRRPDSRY